uniref:Uncharacterized protein n=1 Tax=Tanacetum cinerariifolium TaxID=118510 RepID=A0A6L2MU69_TANCI|nr:hypothetical protein [Tanacetum cinerariifolium]
MSSSRITYTSVYSNFESWRFQWVSNDEPQSPEVAPQLPKQASPSLDYVPGPEHPPSPDYEHGPEYPEYVAPADEEIPVEDQPIPADASHVALSSGYVADSDPEEDLEEDLTDYPADGGDEREEEEEESSKTNDDDETEEASKEEDEHLASADSTAATQPPPPRSPQTKVLFSQTRLRRAWKTIKLQPAISAFTEALIAEFASTPTPSLPPPSPLSPWESSYAAARQPGHELTSSVDYGFINTMDASICSSESRAMTAVGEAWAHSESRNQAMEALIRALQRDKMPPKKTTTTTHMTDAAIKALIAQGVATMLAKYKFNRGSGNGDDSHDSRSGRRMERASHAIEFATELMDEKIRTFADHQAENKRNLDDNSRNNQNQQQPFKRQNVTRAYTIRRGGEESVRMI